MTALALVDEGTAMPSGLYNIETEAAFLGGLLTQNSLIGSFVDSITAEDFFEPLHGRIYSAIQRQESLRKPATAPFIAPYFEGDEALAKLGGNRYLARLTADGQGLTHPGAFAEQIVDLARRRKLRAGLLAAAAACGDAERNLADIASEADAAIQTQAINQSRHVTLAEAASALERALDEPDTGVTCPLIPELDSLLGRLRPGRVYVVAGRPGMGKTTVALNYGRSAAQIGHGVQYISMEMSAEDLAGKAISEASFSGPDDIHVPHVGIEKRNLTSQQRRGMRATIGFLETLPFEIVDEGSMTIGRIRSRVRSCKRRMAAKGQRLDLVIVDYLQLANSDRAGRSIIETVTEVSRGLKAIAMEEQVAVMALAQLSRAVEQRADKRPTMSDLRESGQIEQDADAILFLLREEHYLKMSEPDIGSDARAAWEANFNRFAGMIEFILAKKRLGSTGTAYGRFHGVYQAVR